MAPDVTGGCAYDRVMNRLPLLAGALLLIMAACGDDDASPSPTSGSSATSPASTSTAAEEPTTTMAPTTTTEPVTTTGFTAPPQTVPNPDREPFVGIWRWAGTHTRYMELVDHGVIGTGAIVDSNLQLTRFGEWDVIDGVMTIRFLSIDGSCGDDDIGTYEVSISGSNLRMILEEDPCDHRVLWLLGTDRTSRTWLPDDASGA